MSSCDKALVRIAFEELDYPYRPGRFRYDLDWRQIRDQEADPGEAELPCGWLEAIGNHTEAASGGHRSSELGRPDAAKRR
jgi:hypothetical protein